jgi:hypothetical protein
MIVFRAIAAALGPLRTTLLLLLSCLGRRRAFAEGEEGESSWASLFDGEAC